MGGRAIIVNMFVADTVFPAMGTNSVLTTVYL
jgi:hypothetical protein